MSSIHLSKPERNIDMRAAWDALSLILRNADFVICNLVGSTKSDNRAPSEFVVYGF